MVLRLVQILDVEQRIHVGLVERHAIWNLLLLCVLVLGICSIRFLFLLLQLLFELLDSGCHIDLGFGGFAEGLHELFLVVDPTVVDLILSPQEVVILVEFIVDFGEILDSGLKEAFLLLLLLLSFSFKS